MHTHELLTGKTFVTSGCKKLFYETLNQFHRDAIRFLSYSYHTFQTGSNSGKAGNTFRHVWRVFAVLQRQTRQVGGNADILSHPGP